MLRLFFLLALSLSMAASAAAQGQSQVQSPAGRLDIHVSQSLLITLPSPAETVFVAEPEIASYQMVNANRIMVFGRLPGQTSLMAMDAEGEPIYSSTVIVRYDTSQMSEALKREFPSLNLKLTPAADGIAVSGVVPTPQVASDIIALLDSFVQLGAPSAMTASMPSQPMGGSSSSSEESTTTGASAGKGTLAARYGKIINRLTINMPTQVTIRVRVAEVNRNLSEQLGIKWFYRKSGTYQGGKSFIFGTSDSSMSFLDVPFEGLESVPDLAGMVDALAEENVISVLAEPNLTVLSGETASFLAGGQVPFPTVQDDGNVSVEFKDFGILLGVTATILSPDRVSLRVRPEVSEPSMANGITTNGMIVPGFVVRRAETTVELASGQSFAIGGLLQSNLSNEVSKIPILGDIPVLGALARSTAFKRGETELLIIATAYIAEPTDGSNIRLPNADIVVPSFFERMFVGSKPKVGPGPLQPSDFLYY
jgi:pilus assembly protein CpaC